VVVFFIVGVVMGVVVWGVVVDVDAVVVVVVVGGGGGGGGPFDPDVGWGVDDAGVLLQARRLGSMGGGAGGRSSMGR